MADALYQQNEFGTSTMRTRPLFERSVLQIDPNARLLNAAVYIVDDSPKKLHAVHDARGVVLQQYVQQDRPHLSNTRQENIFLRSRPRITRNDCRSTDEVGDPTSSIHRKNSSSLYAYSIPVLTSQKRSQPRWPPCQASLASFILEAASLFLIVN